MINGFEEYTEKLTKHELNMVPRMVEGLNRCVGESNAVKNTVIQKRLEKEGYGKVGSARVRKLINFIRMKGMVCRLIATSKGYYIENDTHKYEKYILSLRQRAGAINALADQLTVQGL